MSSLELGTCGGQDCILKCTCGTGWSDTGSGAYIKRTSKNAYAFTGGASSRAASSTPQYKTCYKSVSCSDYFSGYTSGANVSSGHYGYTASTGTDGDTLYCHKDVDTCTYSCPSDYYTSATDGYKLTSTSKNKELVKSSTYSYNCSATNTIKCYTQIAKTCADYHTDGQLSDTKDGWKSPSNESVKLGDSTKTCYYGFTAKTCADYHTDGQTSKTKAGWKNPSNEKVKLGDTDTTCYYGFTAKTCADYDYEASIPDGQTCTEVKTVQLGDSTGTCYKDCKDYFIDVTITANAYDVEATWRLYADKDCTGKLIAFNNNNYKFAQEISQKLSLKPGKYYLRAITWGYYCGSQYLSNCNNGPHRSYCTEITISDSKTKQSYELWQPDCSVTCSDTLYHSYDAYNVILPYVTSWYENKPY